MNLPAPPTPEQQIIIDRITAQRLRWYAQHMSRKHRAASSHAAATTSAASSTVSQMALDGLTQVLALVRSHPAAVAAAVGVMFVLGPRRLLRWSDVVLPVLLRYWNSSSNSNSRR